MPAGTDQPDSLTGRDVFARRDESFDGLDARDEVAGVGHGQHRAVDDDAGEGDNAVGGRIHGVSRPRRQIDAPMPVGVGICRRDERPGHGVRGSDGPPPRAQGNGGLREEPERGEKRSGKQSRGNHGQP